MKRAAAASLVVACGVAAFAGAHALDRPEPPTPPTPAPPALGGVSVVTAGRYGVGDGARLMSGAAAVLWSASDRPVEVVSVEGLGEHGVELLDVRVAPYAESNPSFVGQVAPGDLQAQVDQEARTAPPPRLRPLEGLQIPCCGQGYDVYLDAAVVGDGAAGWLAGARITYEVAGERHQLDLVAPLTWCTSKTVDRACSTVEQAATRALERVP